MISFLRKLRHRFLQQNRLTQYIIYALGEIILVVIGILIALQVNNWNVERIKNERFLFGLKELYKEIEATYYQQKSIYEKSRYQLALIDSLMLYKDEIPANRIPAMLLVLDQSGMVEDHENNWINQFIEFDPASPEKNELAKGVIKYQNSYNSYSHSITSVKMEYAMLNHLKRYNIPVYPFPTGTSYERFIFTYTQLFNPPDLKAKIDALLQDDAFLADLITIQEIKKTIGRFVETVGLNGESFLDYISTFTPNTDYSFKNIEIIGSATEFKNFGDAIPMQKVSKDDSTWEVDLPLEDGEIKFRTGADWLFDWGRGEFDEKTLLFKGGNISVKKGFYRIRVNIKEDTYSLTPKNPI
ncbi:DUF6090 family protein [Aegicerativicinus sediminis]|uniref:DUF6090 family protein n=1 Tax=Aegicerativicinus sediminis TaxID=2893202 RepID=UPI001E56331D|nr:DUF6090 family protein [Aegicerativicinus sediminis]